MAVLNKIRQQSIVLIVVIAMALFAFVLADVIQSGGLSSQKSQNVIATVNGEDISREDFARQVDAYQRNMGANASTAQAVNQVWEFKLRETLLEEQFEELGIQVGEAQVRRMLALQLGNNPNFTNQAGMFDNMRLQEYVANLRAASPEAYRQWVDYENSVAESARENIYFNLVRAGVGATLLEGEQAYRLENDNVDLRFVQIPYTNIPDSEVKVTKDEINDYVKKNSKRFKSEKARDLQYIVFNEKASPEDEVEVRGLIEQSLLGKARYNAETSSNDTLPGFGEVSRENIGAFVNQNSDIPYQDRYIFRDQFNIGVADTIFNLQPGQIYGPYRQGDFYMVSRMLETRQMADSAKASHIMLPWQGLPSAMGVSRTKEQAKTLADSLAGVVRADRTKFADLAAQFSGDQASQALGGDLGYFRPGEFIPPFEAFVFNNSVGSVGVVESEFGYHIIHVEEKTDPKQAIKIATIAREVQPSEASLNELYTRVTRFEMDAKNNDFIGVARKEDLDVRTVKDVKPLEENIPGVGAQRRIVQWAFEDNVKAGDISRFEIPGGYVVAQVTAVKKEGLMSAEDASATVTPILMREKKAKLLKERITGNNLEQIAQNNNASVQTAGSVNMKNPTLAGGGNEPEVVGAAFALDPGQMSRPIAGNRGVYVVEVTSVNRAPEMESYRSYAIQQTQQKRQGVEGRVFEALKENAKIEDNRANFY